MKMAAWKTILMKLWQKNSIKIQILAKYMLKMGFFANFLKRDFRFWGVEVVGRPFVVVVVGMSLGTMMGLLAAFAN